MQKKNLVLSLALLVACGVTLAKLPPMDDAAKAKAAETAAKAAWQAKVDAFQLCKVQDRIAAQYKKSAAAAPAKAASGAVPAAPNGAVAAAAASSTAAVATAAAPARPASATTATTANTTSAVAGLPLVVPKPAVQASAPGQPAQAAPATTPVAAVAPSAGCADPGPFAYTPPEQKPLETSGAHSPAGTATSPPSVNKPHAEMNQKK